MAETPSTTGPDHPADPSLADLLEVAQTRPGSDLDKLPRRLSPSRASDFVQCPQKFYYKTICKLSEPQSVQTVRGTLAHEAFERTFDLPEGERTPELAIGYLRPAWAQMTDVEFNPQGHAPDSEERQRDIARALDYLQAVPAGSELEAEMFAFAETQVRNWFEMERVNNFSPNALMTPDGNVIDGRELHVSHDLTDEVNVHGYIDRLDSWETGAGQTMYAITDYKTGKVVGAGKTYSADTMARIRYESFFQLRVYAVLMYAMYGIKVHALRLLYTNTGDRTGGIKTLTVTERIVRNTRAELTAIWDGIMRSARTGHWQPKPGPLCNYCYFQDICPSQNGRALPVTEIAQAS